MCSYGLQCELPAFLFNLRLPFYVSVLIFPFNSATSCSVPVIFSASPLMAKDPLTGEAVPWNQSPQRWIDGSVDNDLPMARLSEMFNVNHFIVSQVNPHVVPFIVKDEEPVGLDPGPRPLLSSNWFRIISGLARDEALYRINVLSDLGVFPNTLTKMASIMSQKYSGDINILPEISYIDFPNMLKNPTADFMQNACLIGERATWPKLARVRNHCAIELALDAAVQSMRARVAFSPSQVDLRLSNFAGTVGKFTDTDSRKGRIRTVRRRSHGSESKRVKAEKHRGKQPHVAHLHRSRSTVFMVEGKHSQESDISQDLAGNLQAASMLNQVKASSPLGVSFAIGSDSEDELQTSGGLDAFPWDTGSYVNVPPQPTKTRPPRHADRRSSLGSIATAENNPELQPNRFSSSKARPASLTLTPSPSLMMTPQSPPLSPTQPRTSPGHPPKRQPSHRRLLGQSFESN